MISSIESNIFMLLTSTPKIYSLKKEIIMTDQPSNFAQDNKGWNISLWIAALLLALLYFSGIYFHLLIDPAQGAEMGAVWMSEYPAWFSNSIGIIEIIGVIGLLIPAALRIKPNLSVLAAWGLFAIQPLAIAFHVSRGEFEPLPFNVVLVLLAVFVIWGRSKKAVIQAK
jgi:uncharacterized membrane protein